MCTMSSQSVVLPGGRSGVMVSYEREIEAPKGGRWKTCWRPTSPMDTNERSGLNWRRLRVSNIKLGSERAQANGKENLRRVNSGSDIDNCDIENFHLFKTTRPKQMESEQPLAAAAAATLEAHDKIKSRLGATARRLQEPDKATIYTIENQPAGSGARSDYLARNQNYRRRRRWRLNQVPKTFVKLLCQLVAFSWASKLHLSTLAASGVRCKQIPLPLPTAHLLPQVLLLILILMQIISGPLLVVEDYGQINCVVSPPNLFVNHVGRLGLVSAQELHRPSNNGQNQRIKTHVRVGILLEESNYEQANMFIRTIKMINEQKDETIRQLLSAFATAAARQQQRQQDRQHSEGKPPIGSTPVGAHSLLGSAGMQNMSELSDYKDDDHDDHHHHLDPLTGEMQQQQQHHQDRKLEHQLHEPKGLSVAEAAGAGVATEVAANLVVREGLASRRLHRQKHQHQQQQDQQQQRRSAYQSDNTHAYGPAGRTRAPATRVEFNNATNETGKMSETHDDDDDDKLGRRWVRLARSARSDRLARLASEQLVNFNIRLDPMIEFLRDRNSALEADEKVCQLIDSGVQAIFGPLDGLAITHVQSICDNLEIPYFELRSFINGIGVDTWPAAGLPSMGPANLLIKPREELHKEITTTTKTKTKTTTTTLNQQQMANKLEALTVNLYPPGHLLNSAYIDLIYALNWTSFAIVYEDGSSMIRLQNIFKESSPTSSWANRWRIRLFRYDGAQSSEPALAGSVDDLESIEAPPADGHEKHPHAIPSNMSAGSLDQHHLINQHNSDVKSKHSNPGRPGEIKSPSLDNDYLGKKTSRLHMRDTEQAASQGSTASYRDVFWRVKLTGEHNILLDVKTENLYESLKQAQQVGCMTEDYSYLITSLDLHMINLEDFKYSRTKITGLSLLQVSKTVAGQQVELEFATSQAPTTNPVATPKFDEQYLENLGLPNLRQSNIGLGGNLNYLPGKLSSNNLTKQLDPNNNNNNNTKAQASVSSSSSSFNWLNEAESNDQTRREMLQSSPASLGLLPTVDRNNEQKLFDFFLEQQKRNLSRVRLSTSSAILHDSLILLMLGLSELDPSGQFLRNTTGDGNRHGMDEEKKKKKKEKKKKEEEDEDDDDHNDDPDYYYYYNNNQDQYLGTSGKCSLEAEPWAHGSSLVNYMKQVAEFSGLTGPISFDQRGLRSDFKLDVLGMAPNLRLVKVGEWHSRATADETRHRFRHDYHNTKQQLAHQPGNLQNNLPPPATNIEQTILDAGKKFATGLLDDSENDFVSSSAGAGAAADANVDAQMDSKSYDELSMRYELQLKQYHKLLATGNQVHVPYRRRVSPNGALLVNEIIFERLYREQADKVDTLIVTAKLSQPYFMLKETPSKLDGNDQFEGYAVDLIHELSKLVNFRYKWREVADKKYGSKEVLANGSVVWNGMIGEIVRGTADLAIVDLTITAQREEAVDFTLPFMNTGISILFKKPTTKVTTLFSFLSPFSSDVWAYVLAAYCGISAILFLVGHLSPYEWADPHPCRHLNPDSDLTVLKNQFSLLNSFWFTIGSLMQQGSDLTPRSMSTRTIAGIWYFFTLIMISSYTANLAAFLTVEKVVYPIENVRDLSNQQEIKYGCVESGSTCLFFHDSQIDTYKKIDETMGRHKTYVRSNDEGQKRVGEGKFAFFMESTTIEYIIERNCNLTQIGGLIDSKGYGLATSKKSRHKRPYRTLLNEGILHLQETGMLHVLKNRWWKEKRGGGTCTDDGKGGGVTELSLANVGGVFVVLLGGLGISFLVAIAEFIWRARRSGSTRDRMCEEMMNDLKFALACKSSTKPIQMTGNGNNFKRVAKLSRGGGGPNGNEPFARPTRGMANGRVTSDEKLHLQRENDTAKTINGMLRHHDKRMANGGHLCQSAPIQTWQQQLQQHRQGLMNSATQIDEIGPTISKQCDPILLHAMLTMLSSNQDLAAAQAELDLAATNHRGQFAVPRTAPSTTYDAYLGRQLHLMSQNSSTGQTNLNDADNDEGEEEEDHDDDDDDDDDGEQFELDEGSDLQQQQQQHHHHRQQQQIAQIGPSKRRQMLLSQQTIDTD